VAVQDSARPGTRAVVAEIVAIVAVALLPLTSTVSARQLRARAGRLCVYGAADQPVLAVPLTLRRHPTLQPALVATLDEGPRHTVSGLAAMVAARLRVRRPRGLLDVAPVAIAATLPTALCPAALERRRTGVGSAAQGNFEIFAFL